MCDKGKVNWEIEYWNQPLNFFSAIQVTRSFIDRIKYCYKKSIDLI